MSIHQDIHVHCIFPMFSDLEEQTVGTFISQTTQTESFVTGTDMGVQTDLCFDDLAQYSDSELHDKKKLQRSLFTSYILKDDESCKFYTGE